MRYFILTLFVLMVSFPAYAEKPLGQGDSVPTISLSDQNGVVQTWDGLYGKKGVVVVFYRSAAWCPYCQSQLIELGRNKEKFDREGYNLVGVSYDSVEKLKKFDNKFNPDFPLLSDEGSRLIEEFGIMDDSHKEGSFAFGVPKPAIYVVRKNGIIQSVLSEEGYKIRPEIADIMASIQKGNE